MVRYTNAYHRKRNSLETRCIAGHTKNDLGKFEECQQLQGYHMCVFEVADIAVSFCLPESCPASAYQNTSSSLFYGYMVWQATTEIYTLLYADMDDAKVTCGNHSTPISQAGAVFIAVACLLLLVACTPQLLREAGFGAARLKRRIADGGSAANATGTNNEPLLSRAATSLSGRPPSHDEVGGASSQGTPDGVCSRCVGGRGSLLWRLRRNVTHRRYLFIPGVDALRALAGVHVGISMTLLYMRAAGFASPALLQPKTGTMGTIMFAFMAGGEYSVDTLLTISGFIVVTLLRQAVPRGTPWLQATLRLLRVLGWIILRWWLQVVLIVCMSAFVLPILGSGPLWSHALTMADNCREQLWTSVALLNNYLPEQPWSQQCMPAAFITPLAAQLALGAGVLLLLGTRLVRGVSVLSAVALWAVLAATALAMVHAAGANSTLLYKDTAQSTIDVFSTAYVLHFQGNALARGSAWAAGATAAMLWAAWGGRPTPVRKRQSKEASGGVDPVLSRLLVVGFRAFVPPRPVQERAGADPWRMCALVLALVGQSAILLCSALPQNPQWSSITVSQQQAVWFTGLSHVAWSMCSGVIVLLAADGGVGSMSTLLHSPVWSLTAHLVGATTGILQVVLPMMTLTSSSFIVYSPARVLQVFVLGSVISLVGAVWMHEAFVVPLRNSVAMLAGAPSIVFSSSSPNGASGLHGESSDSEDGASALSGDGAEMRSVANTVSRASPRAITRGSAAGSLVSASFLPGSLVGSFVSPSMMASPGRGMHPLAGSLNQYAPGSLYEGGLHGHGSLGMPQASFGAKQPMGRDNSPSASTVTGLVAHGNTFVRSSLLRLRGDREVLEGGGAQPGTPSGEGLSTSPRRGPSGPHGGDPLRMFDGVSTPGAAAGQGSPLVNQPTVQASRSPVRTSRRGLRHAA